MDIIHETEIVEEGHKRVRTAYSSRHACPGELDECASTSVSRAANRNNDPIVELKLKFATGQLSDQNCISVTTTHTGQTGFTSIVTCAVAETPPNPQNPTFQTQK